MKREKRKKNNTVCIVLLHMSTYTIVWTYFHVCICALYSNMYTCICPSYVMDGLYKEGGRCIYIYIRIYIVYSNCLFLPYKKRPPGSHSLISPDHVKEDSLIFTHLNRRQLILYIYKRADAAFLCKLMIINNRFL